MAFEQHDQKPYEFIWFLTGNITSAYGIYIYIYTRVNPCAYKCTLQRQPAAKNRHEKVGHVSTFGHYCGHHFGFHFNHTNGRSVGRSMSSTRARFQHVPAQCPPEVRSGQGGGVQGRADLSRKTCQAHLGGLSGQPGEPV